VASIIPYIPILTTILSGIFGISIYRRYLKKSKPPHLGWWAGGIFIYGLGTLTESLVTLFGWNPVFFRLWYISGALLGGSPLAQGSVYYHLNRRVANFLTSALLSYIAIASFFVLIVPLRTSLVEPHRLTGRVMEWGWVRLFSPLVNLYALIFLAGGAAFSAYKYFQRTDSYHRFIGNVLIAVGALLPGIGGAFTRFGYTEVLYGMEFVGILLIWRGYLYCIREPEKTRCKMVEVGGR